MSNCSVAALQTPDGGSDEDGRCPVVGAIVVECCCESGDDSSGGTTDRPEIQRQDTPEQQQGELKHHWEALDGGVKPPLLGSI